MKKVLHEIIKRCLDIEINAFEIYTRCSQKCAEEKHKSFWVKVANEEKEHQLFWRNLIDVIQNIDNLIIFDDSEEILEELEEMAIKSNNMLLDTETTCEIQKLFINALELEFYMLHPAFEILFHYMSIYLNESTPEENYRQHLQGFIETLKKWGIADKKNRLIGNLLLKLWNNNKDLANISSSDALTGVLNRRGISNGMAIMSNIAQRNSFNVGLMMIDIDDFKKINDTYGHQTGGKVLKEITHLLKSNLRESDIIGRYGGEEFLVFMTNVDDDYLYGISEKIRLKIHTENSFEFPVSVSIGVAQKKLAEKAPFNVDNMIKEADMYLYQAKDMGKNKVCMDYLG